MAAERSDTQLNSQIQICAELQFLHKLFLIDVPEESSTRPKELADELRHLDTIAICLTTGSPGDVVATKFINSPSPSAGQPALYEVAVARNAQPEDHHVKAADRFFRSLKPDPAQRDMIAKVLTTVHAHSAKTMDHRRNKIWDRCRRILGFKSTNKGQHVNIDQDIVTQLEQIQKVADHSNLRLLPNSEYPSSHGRTYNRGLASTIKEFKRLAVLCMKFMKDLFQTRLVAMTQSTRSNEAANSPAFKTAVKKLGSALNKICQYSVGLDRLIKKRASWKYRWIDHTKTSEYAIEFPKAQGKSLEIPGYIEAWHKYGIKIPLVTKDVKRMAPEQKRYLWEKLGEKGVEPTANEMQKALAEKKITGPQIVPLSDKELEDGLKNSRGGPRWHAIINTSDSDGGWAKQLNPVLHAELRIMLHFDGFEPGNHGPQAIGVSKRSCGGCTLTMLHYNIVFETEWYTSGYHGKYYPNFSVLGLLQPRNAPERYLALLRTIVNNFFRDIKEKLDEYLPAFRKGSYMPSDSGVSDHSMTDIRAAIIAAAG